MGFREKQGKYVADVQRCEVLAEPVASLVGVLGELLTGMERRTSIPQIEVALSDGERVLVFRVLDPLPESTSKPCARSNARTACASCCSRAASTPSRRSPQGPSICTTGSTTST